MLGNDPFYHQLIRKSVVLFGRLFDNIVLVRTNNQTSEEVQRFIVPIVYSPKEKMITRIMSDPDLQKQVQVILPRIGYEITGISYDANRKQNSLLPQVGTSATSTTASSTFMGVPYDINFALTVYTRNIEDGNNIVEQILPFFNPDFTVTSSMIPELGFLKDVPIILNTVTNEIDYQGNFDSVRYCYWTLNFTMKAYFYGPVKTPKYIRTAYTNIWEGGSQYGFSQTYCGYSTRLDVRDANGTFKKHDVVYQGRSPKDAEAQGTVLYYSANTNELLIGNVQGTFKLNVAIHAASTNASCNVTNWSTPPYKAGTMTVTPDPITASPGDDYGYTFELTIY